MGKTAMWRRYLRFWGADPPADVDAEIDFHLDALVQHFIARGMTADQARREASRRFGNVARVRSECLTVDKGSMRSATRREVLDALSQDFRDSLRGLTRNPGLTLGAVLILALGIGLNTTVFSFNKALLFPSLPIGDPPTLVKMWSQNLTRGIFAQPLSEAAAAAAAVSAGQSFDDVAAYTVEPVTLTVASRQSASRQCERRRTSSRCCVLLRKTAVTSSPMMRRVLAVRSRLSAIVHGRIGTAEILLLSAATSSSTAVLIPSSA